MLLAVSLVSGEPRHLPVTSGVWLAFIYLLIATALLYLLYLFVLGRWTASGAAYSFVLIPIGRARPGGRVGWGDPYPAQDR
jgi:hypothetical protein